MNRKLFFNVAAASLIAAILGFSVGKSREGQTQVPVATDPPAKYAMNVVVSGVPFWKETKDTWELIAAKRKDVSLQFGGPLDTNAQKQIDEIEALIAKGVDGLVIAPADSAALAPVIDKAVSKGIPVITYLVDSPTSKRIAYVASELEPASRKVGELVASAGQFKGKAVIVYAKAGNEEQEARRRGFEQVIKANAGMELVGVVEDNYDEAKGAEALKPLLARHPDIKFIFGANSRAAVGAVSALRELGRKSGEIKVTGWDTDADVLDLIKEGWIQASVAQRSAYMTGVVFGMLEALRRDYAYPVGRSFQAAGVSPFPTEISVPVTIVTNANVAGFYYQQKK